MNNGKEVGDRAWKLVRVALLWARKGGVLKRRMWTELRVLLKLLKQLWLCHTNTTPSPKIYYCERQFSFDNTPLFHLNTSSMRFHLPHFPCLNPHPLDFDYDFHEDSQEFDHGYEGSQEILLETTEDEEGIDKRAEEFIAKFYHQMKLQYLQYDETPNTLTT